jgi:hypothetical protein
MGLPLVMATIVPSSPGPPESALGLGRLSRGWGKYSVKVVPSPGWLSTSIAPPWACTMPSTTGSPGRCPARPLGGEEGLEDARTRGLVHAAAVVADGDAHRPHAGCSAAGLGQFSGAARGRPAPTASTAEFDAAGAALQRVHRIGAQVEQHLPSWVASPSAWPAPGATVDRTSCTAAAGGAQQAAGFFHHVARHTGVRASGCWRLKARIWRTSSRPRRAAVLISCRLSRAGCPGSRSWRARSALPRMAARMLLKSCATPPASVPSASIFCDCASCCSSARCCCLRLLERGDVDEGEHHMAQAAQGVVLGVGVAQRPAHLLVADADAAHHQLFTGCPWPAPARTAPRAGAIGWPSSRMQRQCAIGRTAALFPRPRPAQETARRRVHPTQAAVGPEHHHPAPRLIHQRTRLGLALGHGLPRLVGLLAQAQRHQRAVQIITRTSLVIRNTSRKPDATHVQDGRQTPSSQRPVSSSHPSTMDSTVSARSSGIATASRPRRCQVAQHQRGQHDQAGPRRRAPAARPAVSGRQETASSKASCSAQTVPSADAQRQAQRR